MHQPVTTCHLMMAPPRTYHNSATQHSSQVEANPCQSASHLLVFSSVCIMPLLITISSCILLATFLALASFGIALETSDSVTQDLVKKLLVDFKISESDLNELAHFAAKNNHIGAAFIVVGLIMAAVCLIGLISAQNDWKILLNTFAAILIILLFVEAIILIVYFAHPDKLATPLLHTMEELLEAYTDVGSNNSMAKAVWNTVMREELKCDNHVYSECCGINGYEDFGEFRDTLFGGQRMLWLPRECCNSSFNCITSHAQAAGAPGCKDKLTACTAGYSKYLLCVSVFTLLMQQQEDGVQVTNNLLSTFQNAFIVFPIAHVLLKKLDLNQ
ncbi:unnamed protein product [Taenia asiatica]|uniref:Tetraspanin n=1 Tax=Taenia asiatica TaxID=60517 RepID=A0A0R3W6T3_TAEAS|nr:unnamed protein product [Taenia asiatica]